MCILGLVIRAIKLKIGGECSTRGSDKKCVKNFSQKHESKESIQENRKGGDQIKENYIGGECSTRGSDKKCIKNFSQKHESKESIQENRKGMLYGNGNGMWTGQNQRIFGFNFAIVQLTASGCCTK